DALVLPPYRQKIGAAGWFCPFGACEIAYFDLLGANVSVAQLQRPVFPKDPDASICACFEFTYSEIEADVAEGTPIRIRELLAKSQSDAARCQQVAANGQCCLREVQKIYMRLREGGSNY
ncbi:MAG: hypothetical protein KDA42_15670, partial [Planctomycetales bacterium]|nr:hypothetical protein [Planctomycetales bacterium]